MELARRPGTIQLSPASPLTDRELAPFSALQAIGSSLGRPGRDGRCAATTNVANKKKYGGNLQNAAQEDLGTAVRSAKNEAVSRRPS